MGGEVGAPSLPSSPTSVELFSGCGGLALGVARAGFRHLVLAERDGDACDTLELNRGAFAEFSHHPADWELSRGDVREVDWRPFAGRVDLVAGGPPCQPFSIGGKHRGRDDGRDMWPEAIRAVAEMAPRAFLFENVRGLVRPAFAAYLQGVLFRLERPGGDLRYRVRVSRLNAADFGAAQRRDRVMIVGFVEETGVVPSDPTPTHSRERLLWDQWVSGEYWVRHGLPRPDRGRLSKPDAGLVARLESRTEPPPGPPWRTLRDAVSDLGAPDGGNAHIFQPGARVYVGHTGSPLDAPSKALKAGAHGVPGGENMMVLDDGGVRYFTVREAARLQGLPDGWRLSGAWSECMRQLGNAVPVPLAESVAGRVRAALAADTEKGAETGAETGTEKSGARHAA